MFGIDPSSVQGHDLANSILGKTPEEVCKKIPEAWRILHIESIVRSDLTSKFQRAQAGIRKGFEQLPVNILKDSVRAETRLELGKRAIEKETLIDILTAPEMSFHCTREDVVPSIVRQGYLMPDIYSVRCGSTYGQSRHENDYPRSALTISYPWGVASIAHLNPHSRLCIQSSATVVPPNSTN